MTEAEMNLEMVGIGVETAKQRKIIADAGAAIAALELKQAEMYAEFRKQAPA